MAAATGLTGRVGGVWKRTRQRHRWVDHVVRAYERYDECNGGLLAAGVTYYSFFAVFALVLLAFSLAGLAMRDDPTAIAAMERYVEDNIPKLDTAALLKVAGKVGLIGLVGFVLTGLAWVDGLRSAIRLLWRQDPTPGSFLFRRVADLMALGVLGVLMAASIGTAVGVAAALRWILDTGTTVTGVSRAGEIPTVGIWLLNGAGFLLGLAVNAMLAAAILVVVPRERIGFRRVIGPALLVAVGMELLKTVGRLYITQTASNPAYEVVAGAVALLVFLYLFNQLILYAAALTATGEPRRRAGAKHRKQA